MIRILLSTLLFINISYANAEHYFIKLGSFKNLNGLERNIERLPNNLRSHITIIKRNSWYIPFAYYVSNKNSLYKYLPKFKHYFPDAYINHSKNIFQYPIVRDYKKVKKSYQTHSRKIYYRPQTSGHTSKVPYYQNVAISEEDNTQQIPIRVSVSKRLTKTPPLTKVDTKKPYKYFTKRILSGKHYYLAYKSTKGSPNLLIKVSFKNHVVTYQPVIGNMKMTKANYLVENGRLYMFANSFTKDGAYSKLEVHRKNHFLVSSWVNGKKLNTLRYYFDLNDAKEYLNLETSKGLANVLEEGNYDDFFLDDEY